MNFKVHCGPEFLIPQKAILFSLFKLIFSKSQSVPNDKHHAE